MLVKQKYNFLSVPLMYEWTTASVTPFNRAKCASYAYWMSVRDLDISELKFNDVVRLEKIVEYQKKELKRPSFKR
jgi:hypothetical protein